MSAPCNNPCQVIICAVPDDLERYILPPPPPALIFNQQVTLENFCTNGRAPYYSGSALPSWITIDIANNRIIGQWGIYSGTNQAAANATAQAALVLAVQSLGIACVWYSQQLSFVCGDGSTITIPANTYRSTISQADADSQASVAAAAGCALGCAGNNSSNFGIFNYYDGMIPNPSGGAPVAGDVIWDGTFKFMQVVSSCAWGTSPSGIYLLINGRRGAARLYYHTSPNYWYMEIGMVGTNNNNRWAGFKYFGSSPAGIYTASGSTYAVPATITIVAITGNVTLVAGLQY
jgi:hypothetical protein